MTSKEELAHELGLEADPLAQYHSFYASKDADLFEMFIEEIVMPNEPAKRTLNVYRRYIRQYEEFMATVGRHPACPNEDHIKQYIHFLRHERGNSDTTILSNLRTINAAYEYWQADGHFPHPADHNPIASAKQKLSLSREKKKPPHYIPIDQLREDIGRIKNIRDRMIVVLMFKLGLRAGELCNMELQHVNLSAESISEYYDELGTHPRVESYPNAVLIPADIEGNKSKRPRVLPLDKETRVALRQYLLIRPDNGTPWVFLTSSHQIQLEPQDVGHIWTKHFRPKYDETDQYRPVTSHYGRHYFTTYWESKQNLSRTYVKYLRGDETSKDGKQKEGIDHYLHAYYEDLEPIIRQRAFQFDLRSSSSPSSTE